MDHITWFKDFKTLSETENFSAAADMRFTSQSAFSRRIRSLEEWVGEPLFHRTSQKVALTSAGIVFVPYVSQILNILNQGVDEARKAGQTENTTLRIAATHSLSFVFFPNWFRQFETEITARSVQLYSDTLNACENLLVNGDVQFLIGHEYSSEIENQQNKRFQSIIVGKDCLLPVHAAYAKLQFSLSDLDVNTKIPLLSYSDQSGLGKILKDSKVVENSNLSYQKYFSSHLATVLKEMALSGCGVAWLPKSLIEHELTAGTLVIFTKESLKLPMNIRLFRTKTELGDTAEQLWKYANTCYQK